MKKDLRPRIAVFGMGVIGGGPLNQGIPSIADLFSRLSLPYQIDFFSFSRIDTSYVVPSIRVTQVTSWRIPGRLKYILLMLRFLAKHLWRHYDLIFAVAAYPTGQYAVAISKLIKKPVLVQFIALEAVCLKDIGYGNLCSPWLGEITGWVSENATALIMVADYQKKVAQQSMSISRRIDVLPLRIISQDFHFQAREITFPVQFIHIAYYHPIKDQDTMFKAFALAAKKIDCHLTVIGRGFNTPEVQTLVKNLGIAGHLTFLGALPYSQIPTQFKHAHILLHTALFETGCAVIQEAMASGVAVCGTNVGILADLGEEYAAIAPPKDEVKLSEEILKLVGNQVLYKKITGHAYEWITKHNAVWACENYRLFIDGFLSQTNSAGM